MGRLNYEVYFLGVIDFTTDVLEKAFDLISKVVGWAGFEPTTNWLKANCSTG
jgi:hypothetical protein